MAEPSKSTLKALGAVSGNRCAFPSCVAPIYDTSHGKLVGQVAHLKAESPLGSRYDGNQTDAERHGFDNLMFMCGPHHLVIDDAAHLSEYTLESLRSMKRDHEADTRNTILTEDLLERLVQKTVEMIAARLPAWAWVKYRDDIVNKVRNTDAEPALNEGGHDVGDDWTRLEWKSAANNYREKIRALYGTTRVLGKSEPISLEGIFTDVCILNEPAAYQRYDITKLRTDGTTENKSIAGTRIDGLRLVQISTHLFILGKPGAGKTTFLRYLAWQSTKGDFDKIPIFVGLKEWADSGLELMSFIAKQFAGCKFPDAATFVEYILEKGEALVMFDGLDEVRQEDENRTQTISAIRDFTNRYLSCKSVITCRIAATDYTFDHFSYVEIADFTDEQIFTYARKWFGDDSEKYEAFAQRIRRPENRGLYEIASVPILLTLLCLSFNASLEFPHRRVEVYEEAIDALLKTWDATRNIRRDEIYRGLTHTRKRQMLARLAAITFQENKYFVPQQELAKHIVSFLRTLPGAEITAEIDGDSVLKAVEAHHGLLTERARLIYSFSHLTFQEYFAARAVVDDPSGRSLQGLLSADTVASDRWREVILMAASLLDNGEVFFRRFQEAIAQFAEGLPNLAEMFSWADRKARQVKNQDIVAARLYYLSLGLIFDNDRSQSRKRASACQVVLGDAERFLGSQPLNLFRDRLTAFPLGLNQKRAKNEALELDRAYDLPAELDIDSHAKGEDFPRVDLELSRLSFVSSLFARSVSEGPRRVLAAKFAGYYRKLRDRYQLDVPAALEETLKEIDSPDKRLVAPHTWLSFDQQLRTFLIQHSDIGYEWRLGERHVETLTKIIRANSVMSDCLKVAAIADRAGLASQLFLMPLANSESAY